MKPGVGIIKGYSWGTMSFRTTVEYNRDDNHLDLGETSLEFLRRLSPALQVRGAIEGGETGAPDEWGLDTGVFWRFSDFAGLKFDNSLGLSSKATDWALQVGVMSYPVR